MTMNLSPDGFKTDESKSNPMVVAMAHPDCPLPEKAPCVYIVVGPGTILEQCPHFVSDESKPTAECTFTAGG
jgi:hypothetical protein